MNVGRVSQSRGERASVFARSCGHEPNVAVPAISSADKTQSCGTQRLGTAHISQYNSAKTASIKATQSKYVAFLYATMYDELSSTLPWQRYRARARSRIKKFGFIRTIFKANRSIQSLQPGK
eukprot:6180822-Pleurochrysis_carterae.AAC.3